MDKSNNNQQIEENYSTDSTNEVSSDVTESSGQNIPDEEGSEGGVLSSFADQMSKKFDQFDIHINQIKKKMESIECLFKERLGNDIYKDKINDRLHKELQDYKNNLLSKMTQPLINDIISFYDDLDKYLVFYHSNLNELSPEKSLSVLRELKNYILDILEKHDVLSFQSESNQFDPKTQRALKTVKTNNPDKVKQVKTHIKPGFKKHGKIIRSEGVEIYKYTLDEESTPGSEINEINTSKMNP